MWKYARWEQWMFEYSASAVIQWNCRRTFDIIYQYRSINYFSKSSFLAVSFVRFNWISINSIIHTQYDHEEVWQKFLNSNIINFNFNFNEGNCIYRSIHLPIVWRKLPVYSVGFELNRLFLFLYQWNTRSRILNIKIERHISRLVTERHH